MMRSADGLTQTIALSNLIYFADQAIEPNGFMSKADQVVEPHSELELELSCCICVCVCDCR